MKKIFAGIATILLALAMAAMFVSCGDGKEQQGGGGDGGGGTPETEYSITVEQVSGAQLSADKQKAKNGETVTVTATVTDSEKYIASVTANGEECEESDGKYTFTVGNKDVVVTAELGTYKEIAESDFLVWDTDVKQLIATDLTGIEMPALHFLITGPSYYSYEGSVTSSDETVIPTEAITLTPLSDSYISQGNTYVTIDTTKISAGIAYLSLTVENTNVSSESVVVKRIEVVEAKDFEYTTMRETLEFDVFDLKLERGSRFGININCKDEEFLRGIDFSALDYTVEGLENFDKTSENSFAQSANYSSVWIYFDAEDISTNIITITFDYIKGYNYGLSAIFFVDGEPDYTNSLDISHDTATGGGYKEIEIRDGIFDDILFFTEEGVALDLEISMP